MKEIPLVGGDVNVGENVVVRVGETVRRPLSDRAPAVHALLRHFEAVGFDGAPRVLGIDKNGREILSYVDGEPALQPAPGGDEVVEGLGVLLRTMHDAQQGFTLPAGVSWPVGPVAVTPDSVVCHNDLFWPNVIFREGVPSALVDWDLAAPRPRVYDVASAASFWAPLWPDAKAREWGLPTDRRGARLRRLCNSYGLGPEERGTLLDVVSHRNEIAYETHRLWGGVERRPGWAEMWDGGSGAETLARNAWFERQRGDLLAFLT